MDKHETDYSLYLVTDSTPAIFGEERDICAVVEAALRGGVSVVQYRDKTSETAVLVATARRLLEVTRRYGVPLLINDRVDVAAEVGCEGVHIGQDDMDLENARRLLGFDAIIGVSCSSIEETHKATTGGADYLGIGTVFATPTKTNTKTLLGTDGLQKHLSYLSTSGSKVKTVCIGGINATNVSRVLWQSSVHGKTLDGVAVVSAIMAASDPESVASSLRHLIRTPTPFVPTPNTPALSAPPASPETILAQVPTIIHEVREKKPLTHNMTNLVVQNFAANVALCVGASPIMANYGEEARDLARLGGGLVINMGTVTPEGLQNYGQALRAYNEVGRPVVFDPVGAGATTVRRNATKTVFDAGYINVLKGNQSEILSCLPHTTTTTTSQQRGVDSGPPATNLNTLRTSLLELARLRKNIVVCTGEIDYIAAGDVVYTLRNGHAYLGKVTGTGCCLGTVISAFIAALPADPVAAVIAAMLVYELAAERAAEKAAGPGTFVALFLDALAELVEEACVQRAQTQWLRGAKLGVLES